jgi:hypothetical protein
LCFHCNTNPTINPNPAVPTKNGLATGIAIHAITTNPNETIAPALVPGTEKLPKLPSVLGRSFRGSISPPTVAFVFAVVLDFAFDFVFDLAVVGTRFPKRAVLQSIKYPIYVTTLHTSAAMWPKLDFQANLAGRH